MTNKPLNDTIHKVNERVRASICAVPGAASVLRAAGFVEDEACFRLPAPEPTLLQSARGLRNEQISLRPSVSYFSRRRA